MSNFDLKKLTGDDQWFRYWLPYCFIKIEHPNFKHVYMPVNRNYKPLGAISDEWIDYNLFSDQCVVFSKDPRTFTGIWSDINSSGYMYLYDDNAKSRADYFERLSKLFMRSAKIVAKMELPEF